MTYDDIVGTSSSKRAINLNCSQSVACTRINLSNIKIESDKSGQEVISECTNAHGTDSGVVQPKSCLQSWQIWDISQGTLWNLSHTYVPKMSRKSSIEAKL